MIDIWVSRFRQFYQKTNATLQWVQMWADFSMLLDIWQNLSFSFYVCPPLNPSSSLLLILFIIHTRIHKIPLHTYTHSYTKQENTSILHCWEKHTKSNQIVHFYAPITCSYGKELRDSITILLFWFWFWNVPRLQKKITK